MSDEGPSFLARNWKWLVYVVMAIVALSIGDYVAMWACVVLARIQELVDAIALDKTLR